MKKGKKVLVKSLGIIGPSALLFGSFVVTKNPTFVYLGSIYLTGGVLVDRFFKVTEADNKEENTRIIQINDNTTDEDFKKEGPSEEKIISIKEERVTNSLDQLMIRTISEIELLSSESDVPKFKIEDDELEMFLSRMYSFFASKGLTSHFNYYIISIFRKTTYDVIRSGKNSVYIGDVIDSLPYLNRISYKRISAKEIAELKSVLYDEIIHTKVIELKPYN